MASVRGCRWGPEGLEFQRGRSFLTGSLLLLCPPDLGEPVRGGILSIQLLSLVRPNPGSRFGWWGEVELILHLVSWGPLRKSPTLGWRAVVPWRWRWDPVPALSSKGKQVPLVTALALPTRWSWPLLSRASCPLSSHDNILGCPAPLEPKVPSSRGEKGEVSPKSLRTSCL